MVIVLFFKCMTALFNPVHRRGEGVKWGLVSYTVAMFSFVTVFTAMSLDILSVSFIDNREFPGVENLIPPGPLGYEWLISPTALSIIPYAMFTLCNWLADGLLVGFLFDVVLVRPRVQCLFPLQLYRCYIIYSKNIWVVAFPCFMYLASIGACLSSLRSGGNTLG